MRARRQGTNNPYTRVEKVQLENSDILYSSDVMEFDIQPDDSPSKEVIHDESYWQEVRVRTSIVALAGCILDSNTVGTFEQFAEAAVGYADALIKQLKEK